MGRGELPLHSPTRCCHRCREPCTRSAVRPSVVLDVLSTRQEALIALGGVARCSHGWIADPCYVGHPRPVQCLPCRRAVHRLEGCAWCEGSRALHCACFVAPRAPLNRSTKRKSFLEGSMIGRAQLSQIPQAGWADSTLPGLSPSPWVSAMVRFEGAEQIQPARSWDAWCLGAAGLLCHSRSL